MRRLAALALLLEGGTACSGLDDRTWWVDRLEPDSPCYDVDLIDGFDESTTSELHALFACANKFGHLRPLEPAASALEVETRSGDPIGVEVATLLNRMADADLDPLAIAGVLLDALTSPERPVDEILDLTLELGWGDRANRVRTGVVALDDPGATASGVLLPLAPVIPIAARSLLEDPLDAAAFAGDVLVDPETERWLRTVVSALESDEPAVREPLDEILVHLGQAVEVSGAEIRRLVDFFVIRPNPVIDQISPAVDTILSDPLVRQGMVPAIDGLARSGQLDRITADAVWLASVDTDGSTLSPGERSALYRFARLLTDNNREVECLFGVIRFDNLAVDVLRVVADLRPGTVQDIAGLLSALTGGALTQDLLALTCDVTPQTLDDLQAIEAISRPEAEALLTGFIALLDVLETGTDDHLPAFADLAEGLFLSGGVEPLEEALLAVGEAPVTADVVALVPVLLDPASHGLDGGDGQPPVDLRDVIELARWAVAPDPDSGVTGFQRLRPLIATGLAREESWTAIGNLASLLADERTRTSQALDLVPRIVALDPELVLVRQLGPLLGDRELSQPLLRILETSQLVDALLKEPAPEEPEVPLAFWGRLVVTGTLEDVLRLFDTVVNGL